LRAFSFEALDFTVYAIESSTCAYLDIQELVKLKICKDVTQNKKATVLPKSREQANIKCSRKLCIIIC